MSEITIQGHRFEVPIDPSIVAGALMDEGHVHTLQQTRLENIRNNMAAKIKKTLNGSDTLTVEQAAEAQGQVNEYASTYKFGVRTGGVRVVRDPVEKLAFKLAKEALAAAYFAKHGSKLSTEALNENAQKLLDAKREDFVRRAKRQLSDNEKLATEVLAGI